jgi:peroxiredoxin
MSVPDFTVPDQAGRDWTLSAHQPAVLVFYRGDW